MGQRRLSASSPFSGAFQAAAALQKQIDLVRVAIASDDAAALRDLLPVLETHKPSDEDRHTLWRLAGEKAQADTLDLLLSHNPKPFSLRSLMYSAWEGAVSTDNEAAMLWLVQNEKSALALRKQADLAVQAARAGHEGLARRMIAPVCAAEHLLPGVRNKLVSMCLHACSGRGLTALATELMQGYFYKERKFFLTEHAIFRDIVMCAAVGGHKPALQMLLEEGAPYVTPDQLSQLLLAALSNSQRECAEVLLEQGANPLPYNSVPARYAARMLVRHINGCQTAEVAADYAVLEEVLARGAHPAVVRLEFAALAAERKKEADAWLDTTLARLREEHAARLLAVASTDSKIAQAVRTFNNKKWTMVWRESVLHQAARHRVLDKLLAKGVLPFPDAEMWRARNPSGQPLVDLVVASGQVEQMLLRDLWVGKTGALHVFLAQLDERVISTKDKSSLISAVQAATAHGRRSVPSLKL